MAELHHFLCSFIVGVARSSSGGVAIRNVLPVLWMTSCFHIYGAPCAFLSGDSVRAETLTTRRRAVVAEPRFQRREMSRRRVGDQVRRVRPQVSTGGAHLGGAVRRDVRPGRVSDIYQRVRRTAGAEPQRGGASQHRVSCMGARCRHSLESTASFPRRGRHIHRTYGYG